MSSGRKKSYATRLIEAADRDKIASIAREYSESAVFCNQEVIAKRHDCTAKDISRLIAYAIVHCYISYVASIRCMTKAHDNQFHHADFESNRSVSDDYYLKQFYERYLFVLHEFPDQKAAHVLDYYLRHPYIKEVSKDVGLNRIELNIVLARAIMFGVASDEEVEQFKAISMSPRKRTKATEEFLRIICAYRDKICKELPEKILLTKAKLDTYEANMIPDEEGDDKSEEDLLQELTDLEDEISLTMREAIDFLENRLPYSDPQL